jgi:hypothetical protein
VVVISAAVEGSIDEAVVSRLISETGGTPEQVYGKNGNASLRARINGYNHSARHRPWIVLVDLDHEADCAPDLCRAWVPAQAQKMCFRVAVREIEAWLLADRERISKFLSVPVSRIPTSPESENDPKQVMVSLAARSRQRAVREDMVPPAWKRKICRTSLYVKAYGICQCIRSVLASGGCNASGRKPPPLHGFS